MHHQEKHDVSITRLSCVCLNVKQCFKVGFECIKKLLDQQIFIRRILKATAYLYGSPLTF